jgi:hypothetical protein
MQIENRKVFKVIGVIVLRVANYFTFLVSKLLEV